MTGNSLALNSHLHFGLHDALLDASAAVGGVMPLSFETQMLRIGKLLFMRPCSRCPRSRDHICWDEDTAARLHDDISSAMFAGPEKPGRKNRQEYFLGPMIVTADGTNVSSRSSMASSGS